MDFAPHDGPRVNHDEFAFLVFLQEFSGKEFFFHEDLVDIIVKPGIVHDEEAVFAVFFPWELHRPGCHAVHGGCNVQKIVVKVLAEQDGKL